MKQLRTSFVAVCLVASAFFGLVGCVDASDNSANERIYDSRKGELVMANDSDDVNAVGKVRIANVDLESTAAKRLARYEVATTNGKRFKTTVTHNVKRDGAEEVITAEDLDTGEVVTWAFGAESGQFINANGAIANITGDDATSTLVVHTAEGPITLNFADLVEDSAEERAVLDMVAAAVLGTSSFSEDQIDALTAALLAGDEDLGGSNMGFWGWVKKTAKKVAKTVKTAFCSDAMSQVCAAGVEFALTCEGVALQSGAAAVPQIQAICLTPGVLGAGCIVGQVFACN
jgi:hypothetical protein